MEPVGEGPPSGLPPGPAWPPVAQTFAWVLRPVPFMERARRRFGDAFTVRLAQVGTFVFVSDPVQLRRVFTAPDDALAAGVSNRLLEPVLGPRSVLLLDGPEHMRQRRLMLPPFHGERMAAYREVMREVAEEAVRQWPRGRPFRLAPRFQAITLEVIMRAVLGVRERERQAALRDALVRMLTVGARPVSMLPWLRRDYGPGSPVRGFLRVRARADRLLYAEIARRRAAPDLDEREDVLSLLLAARDEAGAPLSDAELRDELMTLLVAGHETTATGLAWAIERMLRAPAALARLRAEARGESGGGEAYAEAVVRETLRRRPPIPVVARRALAPWPLDGHEVPPGAIVTPCIYLVHHRPDLYPEPYAFRPERFLGRAPDTYAWLPFGGGVRRCLGASFALLEMRVVLGTVVRELDLAPAEPGPERIGRRAIVLAPRAGARAVARAS